MLRFNSPFLHQISFFPGMGVGRLTNSARGRELIKAVLSIGLLSSEAQGDGIIKNLRLLLKQTKDGSSTNAPLASQLFSGKNILMPNAD